MWNVARRKKGFICAVFGLGCAVGAGRGAKRQIGAFLGLVVASVGIVAACVAHLVRVAA
jgi:hypothetical protein